MNLQQFLKENVVPAIGCTDPVAIAFASSVAYNSLFYEKFDSTIPLSEQFKKNTPVPIIENITKLSIRTDKGLFKNAYAITIPASNNRKSMKIVAAMGIFGNPALKLGILGNLSPDVIPKADKIVKLGLIEAGVINDNSFNSQLRIEIELEYKKSTTDQKYEKIFVRMLDSYSYINCIRARDSSGNEITIYDQQKMDSDNTKKNEQFPDTIEELWHIATEADQEILKQIKTGIDMNYDIAKKGLSEKYGAGFGWALREIAIKTDCEHSLPIKVKYHAAAAADARMGGCPMPVMTTSGSGNQGITATLPVFFVAKAYNKSEELLYRAVLFSHLVNHFCAINLGLLSPLCGTITKASLGAASGIIYLMGGTLENVHTAINLLAGGMVGMLCDGAKDGCALKVSYSSQAAVESAFMALSNYRLSDENGIVCSNALDTIKTIGQLAIQMKDTDDEILKIMISKKK